LNELKELEQELAIAEKHNFDKQEMSHLKNLIEIKKNKIKIPEKKEWKLKKILFG
jgi:hypothetical protein